MRPTFIRHSVLLFITLVALYAVTTVHAFSFAVPEIVVPPVHELISIEQFEEHLLNSSTPAAIRAKVYDAIQQTGDYKAMMEIQQASPTCRIFNDPNDATFNAIDVMSGCSNVIEAGRKVAINQDSPTPIEAAMTFTHGLFPLNGILNQGCPLPLMTYWCNMLYPPCVTAPVGQTPDGQPIMADIPLMPCESYKQNILYPSCPTVAMMGLLESFPFFPDGQCNSFEPALPWTAAPGTMEGRVSTFPVYDCPAPLVKVDPTTYKHQTVLGGPCSTPCPSFMFTPKEREWRDRFAMGWHIPSMIMGIYLMLSYICIPILRQRTFIAIATTCIVLQEIFIFFPLADQIRKGGWGSGPEALCTGPASEVDGTNFLCGLQGWLHTIGMLGSLIPVNCLSFQLLEKIVFAQKINWTPAQEMWKRRILVGLSLGVPIIFSIVAHGYGQLNGNNVVIGSACGMSKARDVTDGPNLSDGFGMITAAIFVFGALIQLLWVFFYLVYMRIRHNLSLSNAITWAQFRIITIIVVMCSLYFAMFSFRLSMHLFIEEKMGKSIGNWITCMLTTFGGAATCGEKPDYTLPDVWSRYILWIASSGGFTFFIAVSYTHDSVWGWCALLYYYFGQQQGWHWLAPYAKLGGFDQMVEAAQHAMTGRNARRKIDSNTNQANDKDPMSGNSQVNSINNDSRGPAGAATSNNGQLNKSMFNKSKKPLRADGNKGFASSAGASSPQSRPGATSIVEMQTIDSNNTDGGADENNQSILPPPATSSE